MISMTTLMLTLWLSTAESVSAAGDTITEASSATLPTLQSAYERLLKNLGPERAAFVMKQAQHWAPRFYAEIKIAAYKDAEGATRYGSLPADLIVSPYFDDDDVSNNSQHIERIKNLPPDKMPFPMYAEVPFTYRETLTHRFFGFIKYNAKDMGMFGFGAHAHDGEQVWLAVRKDDSPFGKLEVIAMNAHGYPRVYSPDFALEKTLRANIAKGPLRKNPLPVTLTGSEGAWIKTPLGRENVVAQGIPVFVGQGKHALSLCLPEEIDPQNTCVYSCQNEGRAQIQNCMDLGDARPASLPYSLLSFDVLNQDLYASDDPAKVEARNKIYQPGDGYQTTRRGAFTNFWGSFVSAAGRPTVFVKGPEDKKPEANFVWDMWMGNTMESVELQPHKALQFLLKNPETKEMPSEQEVSSVYLYNPDLDVEALHELSTLGKGLGVHQPEVQVLLNCATNAWDAEIREVLLAPQRHPL